MELSVRDAKARFSEVAEAASRGERVIVTRHGTPFVELVAVKPKARIDWDALEAHRRAKGWDKLDLDWSEAFDDPAFSRQVLGLEE